MTDSTVDPKDSAKTEKDVPALPPVRRSNAWDKHPSVLKGSIYRIGKGEEDYVD
jgi:hypothetical protein